MSSRITGRTIKGLVCAIFLLSGCSAYSRSAGSESVSRDRYVLTRTELDGMDQLNAIEAIRRLRPQWLQYRGTSVLIGPNREGLRVYVDRNFFGEAESLSTLMVGVIREIRYMNARQATLRFGTDHTVGAILVTTGGG